MWTEPDRKLIDPVSRRRAIAVLLGSCAATLGPPAPIAEAAAYHRKRINEIPDFTQTDPRLGLPNGGRDHCAVVAAANGLVWLAERRGHRRLLPIKGVNQLERVASVVQTLASDRYMATRLGDPVTRGGTSIVNFVEGLERYLHDVGASGRIRYQGVWGAPAQYVDRVGPPETRWVQQRFKHGDAMWVVLRFYQEDRRGRLAPAGGHMVTLVGYGIGADRRHDRDALIIRDPSIGEEPYFLSVERRRAGKILDQRGREAKSTRNFWQVAAGYPGLNRRIVLVEEIVALEL